MFSYRGLVVLIALCAFGAIQASYLGRDDYRRFKHGLHHHNFNSSNSLGNSNVTLPSGNYSHPVHFNASGNWNLTRPVRSHRPHHFNSSYVGNSNSSFVPSWNSTGQGFRPQPGNFSNSGNFSSSFPQGQRPVTGQGFRPRPGNFSNPGNYSSSFPQGRRPVPGNFSTNLNNSAQREKIFNRRPSYGNVNASRVPTVNRPAYRPAYQPNYRPVYRPAVNSTWSRPSNSSWSYSG